jgi:putative phosphoribosyl transferase
VQVWHVKPARRFLDRSEAGQRLAELLTKYAHQPGVLVVALPRGGVPVAREVARALDCPLDVLIVRKLGVPEQPELAMGAIASGGVCELNSQIIRQRRVSPEDVQEVIRAETRELSRRERAYRGDRAPLDVRGRTAILVDDGLATGTTMRAAVSALRALGAGRIIVAVPVGSPDACRQLAREADEVVCLLRPADLAAISQWYHDFRQTSDQEVRDLLS